MGPPEDDREQTPRILVSNATNICLSPPRRKFLGFAATFCDMAG
jgi:hypothetical protein